MGENERSKHIMAPGTSDIRALATLCLFGFALENPVTLFVTISRRSMSRMEFK